jgi:hypothetical protein
MAEKTTPSENTTEPAKVAAVEPPIVPAVTESVVAPKIEAKVTEPVVEPVKADTTTEPVKPVETVKPSDEVKYELKVGDVPVNPDLIAALTPVFKKAGMKLEDAQELATEYDKFQKAMIPKVMERDLAALKADKELGGLNLSRTQARINDALAAFTTVQERNQLTALGIANNPTLVRMFHRIGVSMQDAPQTEPGPGPRVQVGREKKLYGGGDLVSSGPKVN